MKIGIRLHDAKELPLPERLDEIRSQGFTCAHVALPRVISSVDNGTLTPGFAMYLRRLFWKKKIDFAVLGSYHNLTSPDPEALKATQDIYRANIRFAAHLGCGVVGTETPNAEYESGPACKSDEAFAKFIKGFEPVVGYAEAMGVIVAVEPVAWHIVYDSKRAVKLLDHFNSPNLQIILDPVNMLDMENYQNQADVLKEAIELLGSATAVVHIKDFIVKDGGLLSLAAGLGQMDYEPLIAYVKKHKPYIHATLEDTNPDNAVAARKYIQELWDKC